MGQYRSIHRCLATNDLLFKIKITDSNLCTFCREEIETLVHLFTSCKHVKSFWKEVTSWFSRIVSMDINLNDNEIILIKNMKSYYHFTNLLTFFGKNHIYTRRLNNSHPNFYNFLKEIKSYYKVEKSIFLRNHKNQTLDTRWGAIKTWLENQ